MQIYSFYHHPLSLSSPLSPPSSLFSPHLRRFKPISSSPSPSPSPSSNKLTPNPNPNQPPLEPLELLSKPSPISTLAADTAPASEPETPPEEFRQALAPFLKFFKSRDGDGDGDGESDSDEFAPPRFAPTQEPIASNEEVGAEVVGVKYYEPKRGDFVVGVVVSGNENKLDVNVGADLLGTMLKKEVMPMYTAELDYLLCDVEKEEERGSMGRGRMGVVRDEEALRWEKVEGRPVVEVGTVVFAEVLGRTLSGRPLLSSRRMYRRVAWHRVRQIKQLNEPIVVKIFEWNTGGLLTRIEGLRAFLPKAELLNRVNNFMDLKENVGRRLHVSIVRVDETTNDLIISEKEAWDMLYLKEGTLLQGTVRKIFPYGAQVRIGDTNRSGLLHISNITRARVPSVSDVLEVGEKLKVLVALQILRVSLAYSFQIKRKYFRKLKKWQKGIGKGYQLSRCLLNQIPAPQCFHLMMKPDSIQIGDGSNSNSTRRWMLVMIMPHKCYSCDGILSSFGESMLSHLAFLSAWMEQTNVKKSLSKEMLVKAKL